ncbi:MAG: ankyrin repeat domain-containing protein [Endozoicomonadaceae bacterium]|nr:ankyrin repeat domain-containing protein [Endozoicomonadaceae bacterium]
MKNLTSHPLVIILNRFISFREDSQKRLLFFFFSLLFFCPASFAVFDDGVIDETIKQGNITAVKQLTETGYLNLKRMLCIEGINFPGHRYSFYTYTPLLITVKYGHINITEYLLDKGAAIDQHLSNGITPLMYAAGWGHEELFMLLIIRGADIHAKSNNGKTLLMYAVQGGNSNIIRFVVKKGVDVNKPSNQGDTPLTEAIEREDIETVIYLVKCKASVNTKNLLNITPLMASVMKRNGSHKITAFLVENGANMHAHSDGCQTVLMHAITGRNIESIKYLLDKGVDVNAQDAYGKTALMCAAEQDNAELVNFMLLIIRGADIHAKSNDGKTLLMYAVQGGNSHIIRFVVKKGIDINEPNNQGNTPLTEAIKQEDIETVKYLIKCKASVNTKNLLNITPLMASVMKRNGSHKITAFLVENGANMHAHSDGCQTVLMHAITGRNIESIKYLLDKGVDVNAQDAYGKTALMCAAEQDNAELVKYLLEYGANVDIQDQHGNTALICAMYTPDGLALLDDANAHFDINNPSCREALQCAFDNHKDNLVALKILIRYLKKTSKYCVDVCGPEKTQNLFIEQIAGGSVHKHLLIKNVLILKTLALPCPLQEMAGIVIRKAIRSADYDELQSKSGLPKHITEYLLAKAPPLSFEHRMVVEDIIAQVENNSDA